jgi:hypothetical protein
MFSHLNTKSQSSTQRLGKKKVTSNINSDKRIHPTPKSLQSSVHAYQAQKRRQTSTSMT